MADARDWTLQHPGQLGPLRIGMGRAEAQNCNDVFGAPDRTDDRSDHAAEMETALGDFADFFSPEDRQQALSAVAKLEEQEAGLVIEYRKPSSPILEFRHDRLVAIRTDPRCAELNLDGARLYGRRPDEVVRLFTRLDDKPLALGNSLLFPSLQIELVDFLGEEGGQPFGYIASEDTHHLRFVNIVSRAWIDAVRLSYRPVEVSDLAGL